MSRVRRQRRLFRTAGGAEKAAIASVLGGGKGERREMGRGAREHCKTTSTLVLLFNFFCLFSSLEMGS